MPRDKLARLVKDLPKEAHKEILHFTNLKHKSPSKIERLLFEIPIIKVPLFIFLFFSIAYISTFLPGSLTLIVQSLLTICASAYMIFFIFFLMKRSLRSMYSATNLLGIFVSYILFIISLSIFFAFGYGAIEDAGLGYLTYGRCSDDFVPSMIQTDSDKSTDYFYYTTVTFFTIGYGDICPMGIAKYLSIFNGFIGNFVTVVLMVIVISSYLKRVPADK